MAGPLRRRAACAALALILGAGAAEARAQRAARPLVEILRLALAQNGIPATELPVYLAYCHAESRFQPRVVSPVGAAGLFQLMTGTAAAIAREHPEFRGRGLVLFNPAVESGRRLLPAGPAGRYPLRVLRRYAARLRQIGERARRSPAEADQRFDPYTNALLGTYYIHRLRKTFFDRYRCYRKGAAEHCGTFSGRHATLLAAACFHLGPRRVTDLLAESRAGSVRSYIASARRSKNPSYRKNARYLTRLLTLSGRYARLIEQRRLSREAVARAFGDEIAGHLFTAHELPLGEL